MPMLPSGFLKVFLYFSILSLGGWILETLYRSFIERHFVNAGFLSGPFVPIYGFGALAISAIGQATLRLAPVPAWIAMILAPTLLEYLSSLFLERLFGLRLWDYSNERFNFHGRICLKFSLIWAFLTPVLIFGLNPLVLKLLKFTGPYIEHFAAGFLISYFIIDTWRSAKTVFNFKAFTADIKALIAQGKHFLPSFDNLDSRRLPLEILHLLKPLASFPNLAREFLPSLEALPEWIRDRIERRISRLIKVKKREPENDEKR